MGSQTNRVRAIESAREAWLPEMVARLRPSLLARFGRCPARVLASKIRQAWAGTRYRADRHDATVPGNEVVRDPQNLLQGWAGDCEDQNVFLVGAAFRVCSWGEPIGSLYLPDIKNARHVAFVYSDGGTWRVLDLVQQTRDEAWDGRGEIIQW